MRRKKTDMETKRAKILDQDILIVTKEGDRTFFEIGEEMTSDVAEAVSILMRKLEWDDPMWNMEIGKNIIYENIAPENSLFWLTGGYSEWQSLYHYNKPWIECYLDFQEEFGFMVVNIVKKAKTLNDIRMGFMRYLSLPVLYNFAISKNMIK